MMQYRIDVMENVSLLDRVVIVENLEQHARFESNVVAPVLAVFCIKEKRKTLSGASETAQMEVGKPGGD